jgi:hypothetical protein
LVWLEGPCPPQQNDLLFMPRQCWQVGLACQECCKLTTNQWFVRIAKNLQKSGRFWFSKRKVVSFGTFEHKSGSSMLFTPCSLITTSRRRCSETLRWWLPSLCSLNTTSRFRYGASLSGLRPNKFLLGSIPIGMAGFYIGSPSLTQGTLRHQAWIPRERGAPPLEMVVLNDY